MGAIGCALTFDWYPRGSSPVKTVTIGGTAGAVGLEVAAFTCVGSCDENADAFGAFGSDGTFCSGDVFGEARFCLFC